MKKVIVAIDGPAGAGKSSVASAVAQRLGLALVDTGAIYRSVALACLRAGLSLTDERAVAALLPALEISFRHQGGVNCVLLSGEDVTAAIRTPEISKAASTVSALPAVRAGLLELQRRLGRSEQRGAVLEGRDIGTVVFPDAEVKFFITASDEVRARRRYDELKAKGLEVRFEDVLAEQRKRDLDDSTRAVAPLKPAPDALQLDTSALGLAEVIEQVARTVERVRAEG